MKQLTFIISIFALVILFTNQSYAATNPTPTTAANSSMSEKLDQQINQLKEKIASRVSELNLVEKRGIIATVTEVKANQITMTDLAGNVRFADVDEITKFSSTGSKNFGLSDLTKGTKVTVLGIYNKQSKRILARFIDTYTSPIIYTGTITALHTKDYQVTIMTPDQKQVLVDINPTTKLNSYNPTDGLAHYGFSKLAVGDRVKVIGNPSKKDANLFSALRVIDYIGIAKDPNASSAVPAAAQQTQTSPTPAPTATGKKKLNPIQ